MPRPVVVVVSGPPCAGKTTIAKRIADRFSLPLMGKDSFKEALFDALGWKDRAWSKRLSRASLAMLFQFMEAQLAARCSCVVESNFRTEFDSARFVDLRERYAFEPVQIQCITDGGVLVARFKRRAESGERHPGHCDHLNYEEFEKTLLGGRLEPLAIGGRIIEVDTTDFNAINYTGVFAEVSRALKGSAE
jgi:predicted kinase